MSIYVRFQANAYEVLRAHLLQNRLEQVAFLFTNNRRNGDSVIFEALGYHLVPPDGFALQEEFYVELADEEKARVIKASWDQSAGLAEIHSHPAARGPARFSPSDLAGFDEFVPHVWWRLKGKPYFAVVQGPRNLDALAWTDDPHVAQRIDGVYVGETVLRPTGATSVRVTRRQGA